MKKKAIVTALAVLLLAGLLTGCGGADKAARQTAAVNNGYGGYPMEADMASTEEMALSAGSVAPAAQEGAKIIYSADMDLETTQFDSATQALAALTEEEGGYYASSSVSNRGSYRSANYTIRVPAENYRDFLVRAGALCHLLDLYEYTDDVSESYYDTAGRLETQRTKLDRLQELLSQAEDMEDIIALESAISETEEQIDRLSGELRRYDALVEYSTVTVCLREVYRLSNVEEPAQGFGSRLISALRSGLDGFVSGVEKLLIALAYGWLWLVLAAVIAAVVILLYRRSRKRRAARPKPVPTAYTAPGEKNKD